MSRRSPWVPLRIPASILGFTLIEILIAILVLSIGLLGLAGLQFAALRSTTQSYERTQAAAFAGELADRMRANRVAAGEGRFNLAPFQIPESDADCESADCSFDLAAEFELSQWHERLRSALPGGTAAIQQSCVTGLPCRFRSTHTVTVLWNENRTAAVDASCPDAVDFDPAIHLACIRLSFST